MEPRDDGAAGASGGDGREPIAEQRAPGPWYRRRAPATTPARSYLGGSSPAAAPGARMPLQLTRCDDRCVRWVSATVKSRAARPSQAPPPVTNDAAVAPVSVLARSTPPPPAITSDAAVAPVSVLARSTPPPPAEPLTTPTLAEVAPPLGRAQWCSEPAEPGACRFGSHSDPGPAAAEADKGNQDFAFHLELRSPDAATWVLIGVADGVSQATWSARGARHAAAAFIEAFAELSQHPDFPKGESGLAGEAWSRALAQIFHRTILGRLERDREQLLAERHVDPTWTRELFERTFWSGRDTVRETKKWFQSTLLATALGPHGGFALFLGDGYARVDRRMPSGAWESSPGLDPTRPVSFGLTEREVFSGIERIGQKGAVELGVLVTTDGVSTSSEQGLTRAMEGLGSLPGAESRPPLERFAPASSAECATFLRTLAAMPAGLADVDNMSVAFAARTLVAPGQS